MTKQLSLLPLPPELSHEFFQPPTQWAYTISFTKTTGMLLGVTLGVCWKLWNMPTYSLPTWQVRHAAQLTMTWQRASNCYFQQAMLITPLYTETWHILPLGEANCNDPHCSCCWTFQDKWHYKFFPEHLVCIHSNLFHIQLEYEMSTYGLQNF